MSKPAQTGLPAMPHDVAGMLQRKADARLQPSKPQLPADHGLFSDEPAQLDMLVTIRERQTP